MGRFFRGIVLLGFFALLVGFLGVFLLKIYPYRPLPMRVETNDIILAPGLSAKAVATKLKQAGVIEHPGVFGLWLLVEGYTKRIQSGEYRIVLGMTPKEMIDKMLKGDVVYHRFTIIDGQTLADVRKNLNAEPLIKHETLQWSDIKLAKEVTKGKYQSLEGLLMPETFFYKYGSSDLKMIKRAYHHHQEFSEASWKNREMTLPYHSLYHAMVVASLVEKETSIDSERPIVASVIVNRLKKGMKLQIDPTIIYALGDRFKGDLTTKNMKVKSKYNTYLNYGLPPTPIAMPGKKSIEAAIRPKKTPYLYFVADGSGGHVFSKTYEKHKHHVKVLIKIQEKKNS